MDNPLLEISLTVESELVEPVAEVLARYVKNGVAIESTGVSNNLDGSAGRPIGPLRVFGYLPIDEQLEETRQKLEEALWYLSRIRPLPEPSFRKITDSDWSEAWKPYYQPIPVGSRLMIVPAWLDVAAPGRETIRIDPGMAFGTGTHPSTQLCLKLIEDILKSQPPDFPPINIIDIGCGTAILSMAALRLGASRALALDIDADAVRAAAENVAVNQLSDRLELSQGSLPEILEGRYTIRKAGLVVANILASVCIQLLDEGLAGLLTENGSLVLSGILDTQVEEVITAALQNGLSPLKTCLDGEWAAIQFSLAG